LNWPAPSAAGPAIIAAGSLPAEAEAAIAAAGGRIIGSLDWDAIDGLQPGALVIAAVPDDIGHGALEQLGDLIAASGTAAVIAFGGDALDAVATVLMGPRVQLLCDPTPADWAMALAVAAIGTGGAPSGVREGGDDERLRRLNAEVARIAGLLTALVEGSADASAAVEDRLQGFAAEPPDVTVDPAEIRRVIRARRLRAHFFDGRLLEDPGWDMLLDLFAAELERSQVSVSSLCIAAGVAPTTALRWISRMVDAGLLARVADPGDRRRAFLVLAASASEAMRRYVAAVRRAGLPLV
jgi:hypothetical protein